MQKLKIEITFTHPLTPGSLENWAAYLERMLHEIEPRVKSVTSQVIEVSNVQTSISIESRH